MDHNPATKYQLRSSDEYQIGAGHSVAELLAEYPYLEREDILQALRYAAWRAEERKLVLANA
jgi:uncharacterized protein (DUF433 family)